MFLDLEPIFNNEGACQKFAYELDLSAESLGGAFPFKSPVHVSGEVHNVTGVVEIKAFAAFTLSLACDRCAKPLELEQKTEIFHTLVTSLNDEANDELLLVNEMRFNLDGLVSEDIFLNMPSKFLCREDCKGVCFACGKDLNDGPCSCEKPTDPRLEALKQLLDN